MVLALHRVTKAIVDLDPPLVIHSGDVCEIPNPPVRYMLAVRAELSRLASVRPDGTTRQVVVIAGNHDVSRLSRAGCYLDLFDGIPGLHIVTGTAKRIDFDAGQPGVPAELAGTSVWALPHEALKSLDEVSPEPVPERRNILVAHGVAESSELYSRSVGREYPIPAELMMRDWDYVALGHFHVQGPVSPLGAPKGAGSHIWYAGSTESVDFGDCRNAVVEERGWLEVRFADGPCEVLPHRHATRRMVTLPDVHAEGLTPDEVSAKILAQAAACATAGAVVRQRVMNCTRDLWAMVDTNPAREAAADAVMYRIDPRFAASVESADLGDENASAGLGAVGAMIRARVIASVPVEDREDVLALALRLTGESVGDLAGEAAEPEEFTTHETVAGAEPPDTGPDGTEAPETEAPEEGPPAAGGDPVAPFVDERPLADRLSDVLSSLAEDGMVEVPK
jgi:hypothetical protein